MELKWPTLSLLVLCLIESSTEHSFRMRGGTLYTSTDRLVQMNKDDFSVTVYGKPYAWFVEFYASWCGHCQRFAPTWKGLAADVKNWTKVIRIGAVACSVSENADLCRAQGVHRYPTVKFFSSNAPDDSKGIVFEETDGRDVTSMRHGMIDFIESIVHKPSTWPSLEPIPNLQDSWLAKSSDTRVTAIIVDSVEDNASKYLGREVILDTSIYYPALTVRRMLSHDASRYGVTSFPAVFTLDKNNRLREVLRSSDRKMIVNILQQMIGNGSAVTAATTTTTTISPTVSSSFESDKLYMQDLESHLRYSFWNEIASSPDISGNSLQALKYHVRLLSKYHPGKANVARFLRKVDNWMETVDGNLTGTQWVARLEALESADAYIPDRTKWTGCAGSRPRFRGYPCSIWMTFHALTVSALDTNIQNNRFSPLEVLLGLRSYVRYFFGCTDCAEHFAKMAVTMENEVHHKGDGVMWLWEAHNKVNRRLHGDVSEDKAHIKIQFPAYTKCPGCHLTYTATNQNVTGWEKGHVLQYLRKMYNKHNIVQDTDSYTWTSKVTSRSPVTTAPTPTTLQEEKCIPYTSEWGACSRTCGMGTSFRFSNQNRNCETNKEVRLCQLRPCFTRYPQGLGTCRSTFTGGRESALVYGNCRSVRAYRWFYCGVCRGRSCRPRRSRTVWMAFQCRGRRRGYARVQWIDWCQCK